MIMGWIPFPRRAWLASILASHGMPGARWFPDATLNYAAQVFRHATDERPAILYASETKPLQAISWRELERRVASLAAKLRDLGLRPGDRVAAYLPNIPETAIAFLAVVSIGAVWSLCAPDAGEVAVEERFKQIEPQMVIAVDGYVYNGKTVDRSETVRAIAAKLPTLRHVVIVPALTDALDRARFGQAHDSTELVAGNVPLDIQPVPFDHPLWIVYSSGTTGMPKPIVHGHGGIVLEAVKLITLHNNIAQDDIFRWYTSSAWIMWNCQVGGLLVGATIALYDGCAVSVRPARHCRPRRISGSPTRCVATSGSCRSRAARISRARSSAATRCCRSTARDAMSLPRR